MLDQILNPTNRKWLYGITIAVIAVLTGYDVITADKAPLWLALAAAVLGVVAPAVAIKHVPEADDTNPYFLGEPERGAE